MRTSARTEALYNIFERMLRIRHVEEQIALNYSSGKMRCPTHLSIGQECVPSVIGELTSAEDKAVSTHRCHAHYLGKGGNLKKMIAEIHGRQHGCSSGKGGSMHLIDKKMGFMGSSAIVGNSIAIGTGIGLSLKLERSNNISIVYLGEGATEEGVFHESINFAALKELNVAFICENNLYSVYSPLSVRQPPNRSIVNIARASGINRCGKFDGNNAIDTYKILKTIFREIREHGGPAFLEFNTYRWREHCGPNYDNNIGYRTEEEYREWKKKDPIDLLREKLMNDIHDFTNKERQSLDKIKLECKDAFAFAEQSPYPPQETAYDHIYAGGVQ